MKRIVIVLGFTCYLFTLSHGQSVNSENDLVINQATEILSYKPAVTEQISPICFAEFAEKKPEFKGGFEAMNIWITQNLSMPHFETPDEGTVYVRFIVEASGTISNAKILKGINLSQDQAVLDVIKQMPVWIPGQLEGKNIPTQFDLPIKFTTK